MRLVSAMIFCTVAAGCSADRPLNPSFAVPMADAKAALREMCDHPKALDRPVVIVGGIHDPGFVVSRVARSIRRMTEPDELVESVSFFGSGSGTFDGCREHLIESVDTAFGSPGGDVTVEVDVIGFSMGGLVARHAARPRNDGGKRLRIRRLFTISTPHRGARMASLPTLDDRVLDMRAGSAFLAALDEDLVRADYEMFSYARLGDMIVGAENAAPPGRHPWWVANPPLSFAHLSTPHDPRIVADIARRLRGEEPLATLPAAPIGGELPDSMTFDGSAPRPGT
jgi:hypothetical protein